MVFLLEGGGLIGSRGCLLYQPSSRESFFSGGTSFEGGGANSRGGLLEVLQYFVPHHLQTLDYEWISESPAMDAIQLLTNLGGTMSLWAGVSTVTFMEFIDLFFSSLFGCLVRRPVRDVHVQ